MSRPKRWSPLAMMGVVAIVFGACSGAASPTPTTSSSATTPSTVPASQPTSQAPYDGMVYPETGEAPCGTAPYTGELKKITAVDRLTVEFQLCAPDPAFELSGTTQCPWPCPVVAYDAT